MKLVPSPLFQGLSPADLDALAAAGLLRQKTFAKHTVIFCAGSRVQEIGVVVQGTVHIENLDLWGTKSILSSISAGQAFAETYAFCGDALMVDAVAAEDCTVLLLSTRVLSDARVSPAVRDTLLRNLLAVSMRKSLSLSQRIFCTTPKTVRGRLLTYFSAQRRAGWSSTCPSTASRWPITSTWTAAPSPKSCAKCGTKACWNLKRTISG